MPEQEVRDKPVSNARASGASLLGLDVLRLVAIVCVAAQHFFEGLSSGLPVILGHYHLGQIGVSLFCVLSGYLALQASSAAPLSWLVKRLDKILVPYWITLTAILVMNRVTAYKPATVWQIISQYVGTGYFTHRSLLVGKVTWFISLILVCYAIAAVVRWKRWTLPVFVIAVFALLPFDPHPLRHVLSFLAGMTVAVAPRSRLAGMGLFVACLIGTYGIHRDYAFAPVALLALALARAIPGHSPPVIASMSRMTFEFFLVHAPICLGAAKVTKGFVPVYLPLALGASVIGTWLLQVASRVTQGLFRKLYRLLVIASSTAGSRLVQPASSSNS